jgi:hypothetical protein
MIGVILAPTLTLSAQDYSAPSCPSMGLPGTMIGLGSRMSSG